MEVKAICRELPVLEQVEFAGGRAITIGCEVMTHIF